MRVENEALQWRSAKAGLWMASRGDGRAAGIVIERWTEGFQVTAADGRDLGTFPRLADAREALDRAERLANARARIRTRPGPAKKPNRAEAA